MELPQDFIDHVLSPAGQEFLEKAKQSGESRGQVFDEWDKDENNHVILPGGAGDIGVEEF